MAFYSGPYDDPVQVAFKAADESVTTAVLQDDDDLQLAVKAGKYYAVEFYCVAAGAEDLKFKFSAPGTSTLVWNDFGNLVADLSGAGQLSTAAEVYAVAADLTWANTAADAGYAVSYGLLACDTDGTFKVQFCGAVGVAAVTMKAGSYLILRKLN